MRSAGDDQISISAATPVAAQNIAAHLRSSGRWIEAVAGIESVVVQFDNAIMTFADAEAQLTEALATVVNQSASEAKRVEIPIVYGGDCGPDFELVCEKLGMTSAEFIELHCGEYTVDMLGFIPGFAYIGGLDGRLNVDRLPEPRQFLPAGSVGVAGGRTGLYSLPGPGGWPIVGRTSRVLFDPSSEEPFTLAPGSIVVFIAADSL